MPTRPEDEAIIHKGADERDLILGCYFRHMLPGSFLAKIDEQAHADPVQKGDFVVGQQPGVDHYLMIHFGGGFDPVGCVLQADDRLCDQPVKRFRRASLRRDRTLQHRERDDVATGQSVDKRPVKLVHVAGFDENYWHWRLRKAA